MRLHHLFLLLALAASCLVACGRTQTYIVEQGYEGPVVAIFGVNGGARSSDRHYAIGRLGVSFFESDLEEGAVEVYERTAGHPRKVPESQIIGFKSSAYVACDSVGTALAPTRSIRFFVSDDPPPDWERTLEKAHFEAIAQALDRTGRAIGARCARRDAASVP